MQNIVAHDPSNPFCFCPDCDAELERTVSSPLVKPPVLTGTATVDRAMLDEWHTLFSEVASLLQWHYDATGIQDTEDRAVLCEQAAEKIESILESE